MIDRAKDRLRAPGTFLRILVALFFCLSGIFASLLLSFNAPSFW
jgi:hypothetical protein